MASQGERRSAPDSSPTNGYSCQNTASRGHTIPSSAVDSPTSHARAMCNDGNTLQNMPEKELARPAGLEPAAFSLEVRFLAFQHQQQNGVKLLLLLVLGTVCQRCNHTPKHAKMQQNCIVLYNCQFDLRQKGRPGSAVKGRLWTRVRRPADLSVSAPLVKCENESGDTAC